MTLKDHRSASLTGRGDGGDQRATKSRQQSFVIEIYFRSVSRPNAHEYQEGLLERVRELDRQDVVDEFGVTLVGEKICSCESCRKIEKVQERLEEIEQWREWAASNGVTLSIDEKSVRSSVMGREYEFIVLPTATLVARVGQSIQAVLPNRTEGEVVTPSEFLEGLRQTDVESLPVEFDVEESAF